VRVAADERLLERRHPGADMKIIMPPPSDTEFQPRIKIFSQKAVGEALPMRVLCGITGM
jgi:hypothetical protein